MPLNASVDYGRPPQHIGGMNHNHPATYSLPLPAVILLSAIAIAVGLYLLREPLAALARWALTRRPHWFE